MDVIHYAFIALILFLLYKIMETDYYLTILKLEVKNVQKENIRERSRTLQEVQDAKEMSEKLLQQLKKNEESNTESAGTVTLLEGKQKENVTKIIYKEVGPHNNNNTHVNVNFNINLMPPFADLGFQALTSGSPMGRLSAGMGPLKALKF